MHLRCPMTSTSVPSPHTHKTHIGTVFAWSDLKMTFGTCLLKFVVVFYRPSDFEAASLFGASLFDELRAYSVKPRAVSLLSEGANLFGGSVQLKRLSDVRNHSARLFGE